MKETKSFWQRPEGTTGMIVGIALLFAGMYGLYLALPFLITLLQNTLYAGLLAVAVGCLAFVLIDKRPRTLMFYFYKSLMRKITGFFVEIDPIGILKGYVEDLQKKKEKMQHQLKKLRAEINKLQGVIERNEAEYSKTMGMAEQARKAEKQKLLMLNARKAGRVKNSNVTLRDLLTKMTAIYKVLNKMGETAEFMLEDLKDEVKVKERERNAILAGHSAFKSALSIVRGESDKKEMFDMAMEHLADDFAVKIGEIEDFMETSSHFIEGVDLANGVFEEEAMAELERWESKSDKLLLGDMTADVIELGFGKEKEKVSAGPGHSGAASSYFE